MGVPASCFCSPDPAVFKAMAHGRAGVPAHVKAKSGTIFPIPAGICFLESVRLGCFEGRGQLCEAWLILSVCVTWVKPHPSKKGMIDFSEAGDAGSRRHCPGHGTALALSLPVSRAAACIRPTDANCHAWMPALQPAIFIPRTDIRALELARAGGTSATFDIVVHRRDGSVQEFGMLPRDEAGPIECEAVWAGLGKACSSVAWDKEGRRRGGRRARCGMTVAGPGLARWAGRGEGPSRPLPASWIVPGPSHENPGRLSRRHPCSSYSRSVCHANGHPRGLPRGGLR